MYPYLPFISTIPKCGKLIFLIKESIEPFEAFLLRGLQADDAPFGQTILFMACSYGLLRLVDYMFVQGANLHHFSDLNGNKYLPIEIAACLGHVDVVRFLVERGAFFARSLQIAASSGQLAVVETLLELGAFRDLHIAGTSALINAIIHHRTSICQLLLYNGCNVRRVLEHEVLFQYSLPTGSTVLHLAAKLGYTDIVSSILQRDPSLKDVLAEGKVRPFELASLSVKPLLNENYLVSLVLLRARHGEALQGTLRECFAKGADPNAQDARGFTALMAAAIRNDVVAADLLLDNGAQPYIENQVMLSSYKA